MMRTTKEHLVLFAITALLAVGCTVKREKRLTEEHRTEYEQNTRNDSTVWKSLWKNDSRLQIRVVEQTVEKDTSGRIVRDIRRTYHVERRDSSQKSIQGQNIQKNRQAYSLSRDIRQENLATKKPATIKFLIVLTILAVAVAVGYLIIKKFRYG